jgi:hypothetical protein
LLSPLPVSVVCRPPECAESESGGIIGISKNLEISELDGMGGLQNPGNPAKEGTSD